MGLTMGTALQIFTNPNDLEITVGRGREVGKQMILITRGPERHCTVLLSGDGFDSLEAAVEMVKTTLETIQRVGTEQLTGETSYGTLNEEIIARIVKELNEHQSASTWKFAEAPSVSPG